MVITETFRQLLKRITGIEPAVPAWEADVLPLHHIRITTWYYNIKEAIVHLFLHFGG